MNNERKSQAGTLESNDIMIFLTLSASDGIVVDIESIVMEQYGDAIRQVITDTLAAQGVTDIYVKAVDRGALDCTIKARVLTALARAGVALKGE